MGAGLSLGRHCAGQESGARLPLSRSLHQVTLTHKPTTFEHGSDRAGPELRLDFRGCTFSVQRLARSVSMGPKLVRSPRLLAIVRPAMASSPSLSKDIDVCFGSASRLALRHWLSDF